MGWNKRTFLYQAGILAASNLAIQLLGFLYRIVLSRLVGSEGMGVYTLVMQAYTIVISLSLSGICVAVTTLCAQFYARGDILGIRRLTRIACLTFLGLFVVIAIPVLAFHGEIAAGFLGDPRTDHALCMVLGCILLTGFENILKALFHGAQMVKRTAVSEVGELLLRFGLVTGLLLLFGGGDHGDSAFLILLGMTLSEIYSVIFLGISFFKKFHRRKSAPSNLSGRTILQKLAKIALPSAATAIICNLFSSIATILFPSRLIIAGFTKSEAVSALGVISGMAAPLLLLPLAFVSAVCTLLMPSIAGAAATGKMNVLKRKVDKGIQVTGLIAIPSTALLLPFIPLLCALLFGQTIDIRLAFLLGVHTVISYYLIATVSILNGMSLQKHVLLSAAAGEILQLTLVYFLTAQPRLHVYGYVLGMISGDLLRMLLGLWKIYSATGVKLRFFSNYVVPFATAIIMWGISRFVFFLTVSAGGAAIYGMLSALGLCLCLYFLLLRLLGVNALSYLKRNALSRH